jgi:hypothetical protein
MKTTIPTLFPSNRQRKLSSKLVNLIRLSNAKLKIKIIIWISSKEDVRSLAD